MNMRDEMTVSKILDAALDDELRRVREAFHEGRQYALQRLDAIGRCLRAFSTLTLGDPPMRPEV